MYHVITDASYEANLRDKRGQRWMVRVKLSLIFFEMNHYPAKNKTCIQYGGCALFELKVMTFISPKLLNGGIVALFPTLLWPGFWM